MGKQKTDEAYAELMREYASSNEIADLQKLISLRKKGTARRVTCIRHRAQRIGRMKTAASVA
jgi:hypothetical protein